MGYDLEITVDEVRELGEKLRLVATEFENAEDVASEYADEVGHDGLAGELEEFAENWRIHRNKLMESLESFAEKAREAADGYDGVENDLVDAIEGNNG
ncbi:DUF6317 family protein [Streptomyces marincola]|uniref:DUF6317 family protein n=1 Tax=Streptomyces marincola TaxID=2878388 RepID=UPI001CF3EC7C|nr:DUF6317 family protein [Streptomyces marincola]UCM89495.1 DUF6317 family protein [Streptomyces marincola]